MVTSSPAPTEKPEGPYLIENNIVENFTQDGSINLARGNVGNHIGIGHLEIISNTVYSEYHSSDDAPHLIDLDGRTDGVILDNNLFTTPNTSTATAVRIGRFSGPGTLSQIAQSTDNVWNNYTLTGSGTGPFSYGGTTQTHASLATWNARFSSFGRPDQSEPVPIAHDVADISSGYDPSGSPTTISRFDLRYWRGVLDPHIDDQSRPVYGGARFDFYGNPRPASGVTAGAVQGNSLVFFGTPEGDTMKLVRDSSGMVSFWQNRPLAGLAKTRVYVGVGFTAAKVTGGSADDSLTLQIANSSTMPVTYVSGGGSDTVTGSSGNESVTIQSTSSAPGVTFQPGGGSDSLTVTGGVVTIPATATGDYTERDFSLVAVSASAKLVFAPATLRINRTIVVADSLNLSTTGKLDLANNDMIIRSGSAHDTGSTLVATVRSRLTSGYGGTWSGNGIDSASAHSSSGATKAGLGYFLVGAAGTLDDVLIASGDVIIAYVLEGDADLNGSVNVGDLGALATSYGMTADARWIDGDFNYDGRVDVGDLAILTTDYGSSL